MDNFFAVIIITASATLCFLLYYAGKNYFYRRLIDKKRKIVWRKLYEDEKRYTGSYLRSLVKDLQENKIQWVLIYSRLYPEARLEIAVSPFGANIEISGRMSKASGQVSGKLKSLGIIGTFNSDELVGYRVPFNSKIVTDCIYFLFESILNQKKLHNLKIIASGGPL